MEQDEEIKREELRKNLRDSKEYREQYATLALIENVSNQVQALRRQRGLTQQELADLAGTKQPRISNIEAPPSDDGVPNWELDTLSRIAQALNTRLKISFETYGSLLEEVDSDSLRRSDLDTDPVLNPKPPMPEPDEDAPERTRWMQERMIPWLWGDKLGLETLIGWLQGYGLPPVGHDEDPSQWLLRGIPRNVAPEIREYMKRQLAERLAILLGEQPDLHSLAGERDEQFLISLYSLCAGLEQRAFLAEPLWQAYQHLRYSKPGRLVKDALQTALMKTQEDDRALEKIWIPMVKKGRHWSLSGGAITGYQGILARRKAGKSDFDQLFWALETISKQWEGSGEDKRAFKRLIEEFPSRPKLIQAVGKKTVGLSDWARSLFPRMTETADPTGIEIQVTHEDTSVTTVWRRDGTPYFDLKSPSGREHRKLPLSGKPQRTFLCNEVATTLSDFGDQITDPQQWIHDAFLQSARGVYP